MSQNHMQDGDWDEALLPATQVLHQPVAFAVHVLQLDDVTALDGEVIWAVSWTFSQGLISA